MSSESRVFPSKHEFVQRTLRDFRVAENGRRFVARLKGEGKFRSSVFPELAEREPQVLVELIPFEEWKRPNMFLRWLKALRLPYLAISLMPLLLVLLGKIGAGEEIPRLLSCLLFGSMAFIHLGCNLWSDYEDHLRGVDNPGQSGGSGVIQRLWIPAVHLRNGAALLFLLGCFLGVLMLSLLPQQLIQPRLLWLGVLGVLGAASYSGWPFHYKYFGWGEPVVFLLSGPVVATGAAALFFPESHELLRFALLSLPLAFLVTLRLHAGNMQRIPFDSIAGVLTIARALGFSWSKRAWMMLSAAPFVCVMSLFMAGVVGKETFISFLALPFLWPAWKLLHSISGPLDPACYQLRSVAARLHWIFGLLYSLSFLFQ